MVLMPFSLESAFYIVCAAVALGSGLAIQFIRGPMVRRPPRPVAAIHGVLGAAGLAALLEMLRHGLPPSAMGTTGFTPASAILFALALALGLLMALRQRRPAGVLVAIHASLAIAGFVVLWTVVSLG